MFSIVKHRREKRMIEFDSSMNQFTNFDLNIMLKYFYFHRLLSLLMSVAGGKNKKQKLICNLMVFL